MKPEYVIGASMFILVVAGLGFVLTRPALEEGGPSGAGTPYVEIVNPSGFVNTDKPITIGQFVGKKVILIDFLTYSCINCQRTFPYLNAWYERYKDEGLEIIGIHTPEFAFERDIKNVRTAMEKFGITHPIVLDNDYATWNAYGNRYWPRKYLIDIHGNIVYDHIGEGAYDKTEQKIRELLAERAEVLGEDVYEMGDELAVAAVSEGKNMARSPETYFGAHRNEYLGNGIPGRIGELAFILPETFASNKLYLGGTWNISQEYAESVASDSALVYQYHAGEVYIVADADAPVEVEVWQDGMVVTDAAGEDVQNGVVIIRESRLYKLIKNETSGEHILQLKVRTKGGRLYAFTFG